MTMALSGAKPKTDRSQVRHRIQSEHDWTEIDDVPYLDGPPLPPRSTAEGDDAPVGSLAVFGRWPDATLRWYRAVSRMPHACRWRPTMWEFVWQVAELHARFTEGWKGHNGAELRIRESKLGTTPDALRDLRIRYVPPGTAKQREDAAGGADLPADVKRLDDYRDL
jgi:hypothetical protein